MDSERNGILGILLLIGGVLIFFIVLNYLNIISLSHLYPNQISSLPQQQSTNTKTNQQIASTPPPFTYDTTKAKTLLIKYMKDNIKSEFLPPQLDIKQGLSIDNRLENLKYEFGSYFTTQNSTISANFHYKESSNIPNDYTIYVLPKNISQIDVTVANSLLNFYFKKPFTVSQCQTKAILSFCENFQTLNDGKKGYGVVISNQTKETIIFNCFLPKESKNYSQTSCINQY